LVHPGERLGTVAVVDAGEEKALARAFAMSSKNTHKKRSNLVMMVVSTVLFY
jgi:hypothetical protein